MKEKGILLLKEMKPQQLEELEKMASDYEVIKGWDNESDFPTEKIDILYGWDKEKGQTLLEDEKSQLKWIQMPSAGVDYMDLDLLAKKDIRLTTASGIHSVPISESVLGMLLAYVRGIQQSIRQQTEKQWEEPTGMEELNNKTIMIVGTGHIGKEVGRLAKAFNMKTIGINRSGRNVETMDEIYQQKDLIDHVDEADVLVNILPLTDETKHFFDQKIFSKMKEGSLFINVGRGPSVKTEDLIAALQNGPVAFAGLDVFDEEPLPKESPLWEMENVLITPHISGIAEHYKTRLFMIFKENLQAYLEGEALPRNLVDYNKSY